MKNISCNPRRSPLTGVLSIPGDKSISHRGVMLGALGTGTTRIRHFLSGADCLSTISCFRKLGIEIVETPEEILVKGKGLKGLSPAREELNTGNSGTTTRLLTGILAGQPFTTQVNGDDSIQKRPMNRVITPLSRMGAQIKSDRNNGCAPLTIVGSPLSGIHYVSPIASAQVKSAILLAGLYASSDTSIEEPVLSRDHTERMLRGMGVSCVSRQNLITLHPGPLEPLDLSVPGDISSAAYFIGAALLLPGSELLLPNIGINPTRDGLLRVLSAMGADITLENPREVSGEPVADLLVRSSSLHGTKIQGEVIPALIDEIPLLAVLASCAEGTTVIADAQELKVKESNRIDTVCNGLTALGIQATPTEDGMIIRGNSPISGFSFQGGNIVCAGDHRIAMAFAVASLVAKDTVTLLGGDCVSISFPEFYSLLSRDSFTRP